MSANVHHQGHTHIESYGEHTIIYEEGATSWSAYVEDLPTCVAAADTYEECARLIKEGLVIHLSGLLTDATHSRTPAPSYHSVP